MKANRLLISIFGIIILFLSVWQIGKIFFVPNPGSAIQIEKQLANLAESRSERINDVLTSDIKRLGVLVESPELGNILMREGQVDGEAEYLHNFLELYSYKKIFLFFGDNKLAYSIQAENESTPDVEVDYENNPVFQKAIETTKEKKETEIVSQPLADSDENKEKNLFYFMPIYRQGSRLGTLVLETSREKIEKIIDEDPRLGDTGRIYLVDGNGLLVAPGGLNGQKALMNLSGENVEKCLASKQNNTGEQPQVFDYANYKNEKSTGAYAFVSSANWCVMSEISSQEITSLSNDGKRAIGVLVVVLIAILSLGIYVVTGYPLNVGYVVKIKEKYRHFFKYFSKDCFFARWIYK